MGKIEPTMERRAMGTYSWSLKKSFYPECFLVVLCLGGFGLIADLGGGGSARQMPPFLMTTIAGSIGLAAAMMVWCLAVRCVTVDRDGIRWRRLVGKGGSVARGDIRGVCAPLTSQRRAFLRLGMKGTPGLRLIGIGELDISKPPLHETLAAELGTCAIDPCLEPDSETMVAARRMGRMGHEWRWDSSRRRMWQVAGVACIVVSAVGIGTYSLWLPVLIESEWSMIGIFMLPLVYLCMVIVAVAVGTLLDLVRGGAVLTMLASAKGLTLHRWWRSREIPARDITLEPLYFGKLGLGVRVRWKHTRLERPMVIRESHWTGERGSMIAAMMALFGANRCEPAARERGESTMVQHDRDPVSSV